MPLAASYHNTFPDICPIHAGLLECNAANRESQTNEKPLPPQPAPLALALHKFPDRAPLSAPARMPMAPSMAMTMTMGPMTVDAHEGEKDSATPGTGAGKGEILPASESTLRTTPISLTCFETTESQRQVFQRRPTRALMPPQVRRWLSITDELKEAVCTVSIPGFMSLMYCMHRQREEATMAMLHTTRTDGLLRCPWQGFDVLLGGVHALTFHLHIHDVGAGAYTHACSAAVHSRVLGNSCGTGVLGNKQGVHPFSCSPLSFHVTCPADNWISFFFSLYLTPLYLAALTKTQ